ncbi:hypothetical protein SAMN02745111_00063 [Eubacterium uniforme]|uniref:Toxin-antitoxin system protein n=1 Tax=Eubacterium uniforme TaxID=39495 RepID=A0A1T4V482_9FIRM|nr:DUF6061 family protein [Eubacterium uniforme]SKA59748.1 hypothetical protein SAMN02745111_00063 [Eubacterium uniforme]
MNMVHAEYNPKYNSIDINHYEGYIIRIDCNKAEEGLKITPGHEGILDALAIDNPLEYATMYLEGSMQSWMDCE